jgi:protein CpxP
MKERRWKGDGFGKRGGMRGGMGMRGLRALDLTDAQKEQISGIMETARTVNEPLHIELKALKEKRRGGTELAETDIARLKEIKSQMQQSREQTENTILGILTVEQRQKFDLQKQERQQRREEFRQRRQENKSTKLEKNDGK